MKDIVNTIAEAVKGHRFFDSMGALDYQTLGSLEYDRAQLALSVLCALAPIKTEQFNGVIDVTELHRNLNFLKDCGFSDETIALIDIKIDAPRGSY
jgi:hypothetical protein